MIVKLLTEHHLEFLSLKGGCTGSSESTLVKMSNCWKSHAAAHILSLKQCISRSTAFIRNQIRIHAVSHLHSNLYYILLDFSLAVKAATLIFISGCGSAIPSAKEGK